MRIEGRAQSPVQTQEPLGHVISEAGALAISVTQFLEQEPQVVLLFMEVSQPSLLSLLQLSQSASPEEQVQDKEEVQKCRGYGDETLLGTEGLEEIRRE